MHLDEFQQKVEELKLGGDYSQLTVQNHLERLKANIRNLETLQRMFPVEKATFYANYVEEDFIPEVLIFLCNLADACDLNLNEIARVVTKENKREEYRPE